MTTPADQPGDPTTTPPTDQPGMIPYPRFQQTVEQRAAAEQRAKAAEAELTKLRAELAAAKSTEAPPDLSAEVVKIRGELERTRAEAAAARAGYVDPEAVETAQWLHQRLASEQPFGAWLASLTPETTPPQLAAFRPAPGAPAAPSAPGPPAPPLPRTAVPPGTPNSGLPQYATADEIQAAVARMRAGDPGPYRALKAAGRIRGVPSK